MQYQCLTCLDHRESPGRANLGTLVCMKHAPDPTTIQIQHLMLVMSHHVRDSMHLLTIMPHPNTATRIMITKRMPWRTVLLTAKNRSMYSSGGSGQLIIR